MFRVLALMLSETVLGKAQKSLRMSPQLIPQVPIPVRAGQQGLVQTSVLPSLLRMRCTLETYRKNNDSLLLTFRQLNDGRENADPIGPLYLLSIEMQLHLRHHLRFHPVPARVHLLLIRRLPLRLRHLYLLPRQLQFQPKTRWTLTVPILVRTTKPKGNGTYSWTYRN